jgi:hypothetical protein
MRKILNSGGEPMRVLSQVASLVVQLQMDLLGRRLVSRFGDAVQNGPFAGMTYMPDAAGSMLLPKLIGCYEDELHGVISEIAARQPRLIINIGCGEGYYAVGFARLLPQVRVLAFDTDPQAQNLCRKLADLNDVRDRVDVKGECSPALLEEITAHSPGCVVFCDIEGGEGHLLDPAQAPSLRNSIVVVELHECFEPGIAHRVAQRFAQSHHIRAIGHEPRDARRYPSLQSFVEFDRAIAMCEFRPGPTPWGVMVPKEA